MQHKSFGVSFTALTAFASVASAGWTVTPLHPAGYSGSTITDVRPGQQAGSVSADQSKATIWSGSAASMVLLEPFDFSFRPSFAAGIGVTRYFGSRMASDGNMRPGSWSGTPGSWAPMSTGTESYGSVVGVAGSLIVGAVGDFAAVWTSPTATPTILHPADPSYLLSRTTATSDSQQVGWVQRQVAPFTFVTHAALWSGTASSFVELTTGSFDESIALGVDAGVQVGSADIVVFDPQTNENYAARRAVWWAGTAASQTPLAYLGPVTGNSRATDIHRGVIVGYMASRATVWAGPDFARVTDLHALLPGNSPYSRANSVWVEGDTVYIGGESSNHAVLWVGSLSDLIGCDSIDFNANGVFPEDQDVVDYFNVLAGSTCSACNDIDFNNNGVFPEDQDVIDFFNVLAGGTCGG